MCALVTGVQACALPILGVAELGHYSAVILLIFYPSGMLMRFMTTMYLPRISARQANPPAWERADRALASQTILLAIAMQFGFVLIAPFAVPILYGPQFGIGLLAVCLVALLQTARFIRLWPVTVAMGAGMSHIVMVNNAVRMLAFPAAIAGLILIGGIEGIVSGFLLAEWLAFLTGLTMTNRAQRRPLWHGVGRFFFFLLCSVRLLLLVLFFGTSWWGALA